MKCCIKRHGHPISESSRALQESRTGPIKEEGALPRPLTSPLNRCHQGHKADLPPCLTRSANARGRTISDFLLLSPCPEGQDGAGRVTAGARWPQFTRVWAKRPGRSALLSRGLRLTMLQGPFQNSSHPACAPAEQRARGTISVSLQGTSGHQALAAHDPGPFTGQAQLAHLVLLHFPHQHVEGSSTT